MRERGSELRWRFDLARYNVLSSVAEPVLFGRSRFEEPAPAPAPALRRSPRRGPSHDSSATHSSLCGAALLGPENHQKRPPQPAWRKNSKRYSFPALQPGQIKKLFLKNVFFLLSRMECCSTFLRPTFLLEPEQEPEPVNKKNRSRSRSKMDRLRNTGLPAKAEVGAGPF